MKLPDGPKNPRFLRLIRWIRDPLGYMETCKEKYGDIFKFGGNRLIVMLVAVLAWR